jgi:tetratricopeptide (TPR) repeat protein
MNRRARAEKGISTLFLALLLVVSAAGFAGLKLKLNGVARAKIHGASVIYIPSGRYLKLASFGYPSVMADIIYLWAIQYYSDTSIPDSYRHLDHIFGIIADLDPQYQDPYLTGALIAMFEARQPEAAFKILDRAMVRNPKEWIFPFEAGHFAQMFTKDFDLARKYYERAMNLPDAPAIARRLYANAAFRSQDFDTAWKTWLNVYQTATDDRIRKIASNHLYQVKGAMDTTRISSAARKYRDKYRRWPMNLGQLVRAGFLDQIPKDLDGQDYLYNPSTGEVTLATIPWKR